MTSEAPAETTAEPLALPFKLFEYGTCEKREQSPRFDDFSDHLKVYVDRKDPYLTRSYDGAQPSLRASHYVGLLPFRVRDRTSLLYIAPKGAREDGEDGNLGLRRFLELVFLSDGEDVDLPEDIGFAGKSGAHQFLLFLAHGYARLLDELCRCDFRADYRHEEGELRSRIRGRLNLPAYARLAVRGKRHVLPCRWDEHTPDNWDNRILWGAARRLKQIASGLDQEAAASVWEPFARLAHWFDGVEELPIRSSDLRRSRLWRMSRYYRHALAWARFLLAGSDLPTYGGHAPPLVLDTHKVFEKLAQSIARAAVPGAWVEKRSKSFLTGEHIRRQIRKPDIRLRSADANAVGDAKYKEVLERSMRKGDAALASGEGVLKTCIRARDWDQLYVYMRLTGATSGFFIVPFWNAAENAKPIEWFDRYEFDKSPCDENVRVAVLALNLLHPLSAVKREATDKLAKWLMGQGSASR